MKILIFAVFAIISTDAFAYNYTCKCNLDFKKNDGSQYTESVEVACPDVESSLDLNCEGSEFARTLTTTCSNRKTNESRSNSGWYQLDGYAVSPWPSCSL